MIFGFVNWQTLAWTGLWLAYPLMAERLRSWLIERGQSNGELYDEIAPWLFGLAPAYLAWVLGLIPGRMIGFLGRGGPLGWLLIALLLAGLGFGYWRFLKPRLAVQLPEVRIDHLLLDEPRWAFYRGVSWLWLGNFWWGMLLGFALSLIEWGLVFQIWQPGRRRDPEACFHLGRRASSMLAFALSANLWLTMLFQAGLFWPENQSRLEEGSSV